MHINRKDLASGAIFVAIGLFYLIYAIKTLPMGRALNMGPGYFPIVLSWIMIAIGATVFGRSFFVAQATRFGIVPWRAIVMLTLAIIVFATFLDQLGLLLAVFLAAFLSSMSSSQIKIRTGVIVSLGIALFCTLVFGFGIKLSIPILGTWFGK
jgi:Tripartite tricarboxylate transporter TctB family